ncbi:MAG: hypothetical protein IJY79_04235 [Clostridia bacterium]|nr:hypothetical protein [Clostridia bacterium]
MLKTKIKAFYNKCKNGIKKSVDKIAMCAMMPMGMFTAEATVTDVDSMITSIKGFFSDFTVDNLVKIIGGALALAVVLFLFWFAYRFIKRAVVKALKKGSI